MGDLDLIHDIRLKTLCCFVIARAKPTSDVKWSYIIEQIGIAVEDKAKLHFKVKAYPSHSDIALGAIMTTLALTLFTTQCFVNGSSRSRRDFTSHRYILHFYTLGRQGKTMCCRMHESCTGQSHPTFWRWGQPWSCYHSHVRVTPVTRTACVMTRFTLRIRNTCANELRCQDTLPALVVRP